MKNTIKDIDVKGKKVLLRVDFNVPLDENGNITIYVSSVTRSGDMPKLGAVESDEEWSRIKNVLRELSKGEN